jgi:excisionase family DNA binding protein
MASFLTLNQVAEILGVEYKTVYRLVRSGELPAARIGRVYRVKQGDLDGYFESSKQKLAAETSRELTPLDELWCCVSGKRIISALDIGGYASDTGEPICRSSWDEGLRTSASSGQGGSKHGGAV